MLQQQRRKPHRLVAQLGANRGLGGRAVVALVEQEIECPIHGRKPRRKVSRRGNVEQALRSSEQSLRSRYPLLDRRMAADEGARDLGHAEPAQDVENERDLRLLDQARLLRADARGRDGGVREELAAGMTDWIKTRG
jgi:hypothetical protein